MMRYFLSLSKIILVLFAVCIISFSIIMSHYFICDYYYEEFCRLNEEHTLSEKQVEEILFLFPSKKIEIKESPSSYSIHPEKGEYIVRYSFLSLPSIDVIYNNKKLVVTYIASYE